MHDKKIYGQQRRQGAAEQTKYQRAKPDVLKEPGIMVGSKD